MWTRTEPCDPGVSGTGTVAGFVFCRAAVISSTVNGGVEEGSCQPPVASGYAFEYRSGVQTSLRGAWPTWIG